MLGYRTCFTSKYWPVAYQIAKGKQGQIGAQLRNCAVHLTLTLILVKNFKLREKRNFQSQAFSNVHKAPSTVMEQVLFAPHWLMVAVRLKVLSSPCPV